MGCSKLVAVGFVISIILGAVIGSSAGASFDLNTLFSAAGAFGGLGAFVIAIYAYKFARKETHRWAEREIYSLIDETITAAYQLVKLEHSLRDFFTEPLSSTPKLINADELATPYILKAKIRYIKGVYSFVNKSPELKSVEQMVKDVVDDYEIAIQAYYNCIERPIAKNTEQHYLEGHNAYFRIENKFYDIAEAIESLYPN
ncbi:hypothetical protein [Oceanospirillum sp.]|uniref:hypothetical protein n=1 Tax=Oceanospirillum sp. TaxID=2021254 RepID=UPI003A915835